MVERDKIEGLLHRLLEYTTYLRQIAAQDSQSFLSDPKSIGSARYYLQVSIETCLNVANHIIATERLRAPKDYRDSFKVLNEANILPDDLTHALQRLTGLRNLLVHVYWEVDDRLIYSGIRSELHDFDVFAEHILRFLDQADL